MEADLPAINPHEVSRRLELSVVVPAYNEAWAINNAVQELNSACAALKVSYEIVVCDDGSKDNTLPILRYLETQYAHLRVPHNAQNAGVATTLKKLYRAACGQYVAFWPADLQIPAGELAKLWEKRSCAVVIGNRRHRADKLSRRFASWGFNFLVRLLFKLKVRDVDSVVLYDSKVLEAEFRSQELCLPVEILYRATRYGLSYCEVDIEHRPRLQGSPCGCNPKVALRTLWHLFQAKLHSAWD